MDGSRVLTHLLGGRGVEPAVLVLTAPAQVEVLEVLLEGALVAAERALRALHLLVFLHVVIQFLLQIITEFYISQGYIF